MPLFGRARDMDFFHLISREVVGDVIDTIATIYKISTESVTNIYGEALDKKFEVAVKVKCLIQHDPQTTETDEFGSSVSHVVNFRFQRTTLESQNIYPEVGDIIEWNDSYFEIDDVPVENQMPLGQDYQNFSVLCLTHMISRDKINLDEIRVGDNE